MRRLLLTVAAGLLAACSQLVAPPRPAPGLAEDASAEPRRSLYRVRYQGPDGGGSLRLVLRQVASNRFQLQAADIFGRAVWALDLDGEEVLLLDHRERRACVAGSELRVPELALRQLPLPAVPRVLDSRPPVPLPPGADREEWRDAAGRRWTARWEGEALGGWTLWQDDEPLLWWLRQERGGVLSHRDGSQFRWRQVARESLEPADYRRLEAPADYRFGDCRTEG